MLRSKFVALMLLVLSASVCGSEVLPGKLVLASTDWCPYACARAGKHSDANTQQGIVVEYLAEILGDRGVELEVQFYPWSRAVANARQGNNIHGLLTAVPAEAPGLLFTSVPTMSYGTCVFTRENSGWQYQGLTSLEELRIGYIQDYSYGALMDAYINTHADSDQLMVITSMGGVKQLSRILQAGRIGGFVSDPLVALNELSASDISLKVSACFEQYPFFLALNPDNEWSAALIKWLNQAFADETQKLRLAKLIGGYIDTSIELPLDFPAAGQ
ncbi:MAG: transporter substrate-binding domain-containing protein [Candidatus Pelagadaptatus aseana]|uniref:substrate-binding periplasmic protein n=1 Tax=Candidatus Pelagadaptatus aseana TaxID=3120508 RepID=UPI0039B1369C